MGRIEKTVEYAATPEQVWAVVSDPARFSEWLSLHRSWVGEPPTEFVQGSKITAVVSVLNMPSTIEWTVGALDPGRSVQLTGTGPAAVQVAIGLDVERRDGGTAMTIVAEFEGQLIVGAIGAALEQAGRAELDSSTTKLAHLLA